MNKNHVYPITLSWSLFFIHNLFCYPPVIKRDSREIEITRFFNLKIICKRRILNRLLEGHYGCHQTKIEFLVGTIRSFPIICFLEFGLFVIMGGPPPFSKETQPQPSVPLLPTLFGGSAQEVLGSAKTFVDVWQPGGDVAELSQM